ncbi:hypothetical protein [Streptomyces sp. P5_D11]
MDVIDPEHAIQLYEQAIEAGDTDAMIMLAHLRDMDDIDIEGAEELYWRAAAAGSDEALEVLSQRLDVFGVVEGIVRFYKKAVEAGESQHCRALTEWQKDLEELEEIYRTSPQALDGGVSEVLTFLVRWQAQVGDDDEAESLYAATVSTEGPPVPVISGFAESVIRQAADAGHTELAGWLTELRDRNMDLEGAEQTILHVVDSGNAPAIYPWLYDDPGERWPNFINLWPYGLEPDGSPSAPWYAP